MHREHHMKLKRFEEAKALLRKTIPIARRVLGEGHNVTLRMRWGYAQALLGGAKMGATTLDDFREAVATFEETARAARRALGKAHPLTRAIETGLLSSGNVLATHTRTLYSDELDEVEMPLEELDEVEDA